MTLHKNLLSTFLLLHLFIIGAKVSESARIFTIVNHCRETVWPGVIPGEYFNGGGFALKSGPISCIHGPDCCGNSLKCSGAGKPPSSLAEFTLATLDFYDVSLVDGFNLPMSVTPLNGKGNCSIAGCDSDLRNSCPSELAVKGNGRTVACRSACDVFNTDEYCCRGNFGNPSTCQPTYYSKKFKQACPTSYSYAYDDPTSIFTCKGTDYVIAFCSSRKQPVCTYHNRNLICSDSIGLRPSMGKWWTMILGSTFVITLSMIS
ncbi:Pathogenesis-related thaumatin superfamily protein [Abeliophyllum distichum]|uniref:Pathogenesis-related thaumatin superfamily protein n=1 Tax=Abeliophyllum distichum TaxID=126358 RepID=A0ABD1S926_9LAMI